ncbi:hypothetical protein BJ741DRAFT_627177 [Chytriomyces cf. hyalinus JEL632]|nr:hypothetical protein BJ741DRAFT_627177 [Chytriomyces cf. hyalinus JEL632]
MLHLHYHLVLFALAAARINACSCVLGPSSMVIGDAQVAPAPFRLTETANSSPSVLNCSAMSLQPYNVPRADTSTAATTAASPLLYTVNAAGVISSSDKMCLSAQSDAISFIDCNSTSSNFLSFDALTQVANSPFTGTVKTSSGACLLSNLTVSASPNCSIWTVDYQYSPISNGNSKFINVNALLGTASVQPTVGSNLALDSFGNIFLPDDMDVDACLGANSIIAGAPVIATSCSGGLAVSFFYKINSQLMVSTTTKRKNLCLDTALTGTGLILQTCADTASQIWFL